MGQWRRHLVTGENLELQGRFFPDGPTSAKNSIYSVLSKCGGLGTVPPSHRLYSYNWLSWHIVILLLCNLDFIGKWFETLDGRVQQILKLGVDGGRW